MQEDLDDLITSIELIDEDSLKSKEINRILNLLDSYNMEEYQLFYLKGFLWNQFPFDNEERENQVEFNLKKSIELKSDYIYSKTELSYFYYDQRKFQNVIDLLDSVDLSFFEERGQLWKSLKLQELLLTSKLYSFNQVDKILYNDFLGLISSYMYLPDEELAVPIELANSVLGNIKKEGVIPLAKQVDGLINSKKHRDYIDDKIKKTFKHVLTNSESL